FLFASRLSSWLLGATFLPLALEFERLSLVVSILLTSSLLAAALYVALEPFVRRRWPTSLISWSRLMAGGLSGPLVGRDVLVGATASIVGTAVYHSLIVTTPGFRGERSFAMPVSIFMGERHLLSSLIQLVPDALTGAMVLALLYSLLVMLVRRTWIAAPVFLGILAALTLLQVRVGPIEFFVLLISLALWVVVFVRFGLLSLTAYLLVDRMMLGLPLAFTGDWRSEFAVASLFATGAILMLAAYTTLRTRP